MTWRDLVAQHEGNVAPTERKKRQPSAGHWLKLNDPDWKKNKRKKRRKAAAANHTARSNPELVDQYRRAVLRAR